MSLRDVERAMIVFEHFYEHIDDFRQADHNPAVLCQQDKVRDRLKQYYMHIICSL